MTPLDKAREALAAVEKATAGCWEWRKGRHLHDARSGKIMVATSGSKENIAAIVSAVNFVRADLPALIAEVERLGSLAGANNDYARMLEKQRTDAAAEHERLADRVAKLEGALQFSLGVEITPISDPHAGAKNGKELLRVKAAARALLTPAEGADDGR